MLAGVCCGSRRDSPRRLAWRHGAAAVVRDELEMIAERPAREGLGIAVVDWRGRIVVDPAVLVGKPVLKGTRLAVEFVLDLLANGWTYEQIGDNYPGVTDDDVRACLAYAKEVLQRERVFPVAQP